MEKNAPQEQISQLPIEFLMRKLEIISRIERKKIVAIIREDNSDVAFRSAMACITGGIECIEVALTTPFGLDVIEELSKLDGIVVGAGTVLDAETARLAIQMGAKFLLSPAVNPSMIRICSQYGVVSVPGAFSPTEVVSALEAGADIVKIFPAGLLGPSYLESISSPLPQGLFMPSRPLKNAPLMPAWTPLAFFFVNPTMQSDFNLGLHGLPDPFRG